MKIQIELLGVLADEVQIASVIELPAGATVQQLVDRIGLSAQPGLSISINNRVVRDHRYVLHENDKVLFIPPAIGG